MYEVRNLNQKLIGTISTDKRVFEIQLKDCVTQIHVTPDGTLGISHRKKTVTSYEAVNPPIKQALPRYN